MKIINIENLKVDMLEYMHRLCDEIDIALFHNREAIIKRLEPEVERLKNEKEFRDYIGETLRDKSFHDNFFYNSKNFPFSIIVYLGHIGVPPEENFLVQDIVAIINMENKVFIEYLIKEFLLQYFPQDFKDKVLSNKDYRRLYNLTYGYEEYHQM